MSDAATSTETSPSTPQWTRGDRIRKAREHANMEQTDLGEALDCSAQKVSSLEKGRRTASVDDLLAIADATGVDIAWLIGKSRSTFPQPGTRWTPTGVQLVLVA